jgi:hypothetical protein
MGYINMIGNGFAWDYPTATLNSSFPCPVSGWNLYLIQMQVFTT